MSQRQTTTKNKHAFKINKQKYFNKKHINNSFRAVIKQHKCLQNQKFAEHKTNEGTHTK